MLEFDIAHGNAFGGAKLGGDFLAEGLRQAAHAPFAAGKGHFGLELGVKIDSAGGDADAEAEVEGFDHRGGTTMAGEEEAAAIGVFGAAAGVTGAAGTIGL